MTDIQTLIGQLLATNNTLQETAAVTIRDQAYAIERLATALHIATLRAHPTKTHAEIQAEVKRIVGKFDFGAVFEIPPMENVLPETTHGEREHEMSIDCWCKPTRDTEEPSLIIHNRTEH